MTVEAGTAVDSHTPERERLRREAALDDTIRALPAEIRKSPQHSQRGGEHLMDMQHYKQRLLDLERRLSARVGHEADQGREEFIDAAHDLGDASVADQVASEAFTEADHDAAVLQQVRDALGRVADGTFGKCIVDGGPIEERRLEAVPWTPYCLKHEQALEVAASTRTPTL